MRTFPKNQLVTKIYCMHLSQTLLFGKKEFEILNESILFHNSLMYNKYTIRVEETFLVKKQ